MRTGATIAVAALLSIGLGGCGTFYEFDINDNTGAILNAEYRAILVSEDPRNERGRIVCAEASPDAITATALQLSAALSSPNVPVDASVGVNFARSAASIGIRTVSIQAMRDLLYRMCEAYMNGAIDPGRNHSSSNLTFDEDLTEKIISRLDNILISISAIEGLTGATVAPAVGIGHNVPAVGVSVGGDGEDENSENSSPSATTTVDGNIAFNFHSAQTSPDTTLEHRAAVADAVVRIVCMALKDTCDTSRTGSP